MIRYSNNTSLLGRFFIHSNIKSIAVCFIFFVGMFGMYTYTEASMTPRPAQDFGYITWDDDPLPYTGGCGGAFGCSQGLEGIENIIREYDSDLALLGGDGALNMFGINLTFQEPTFVAQDPAHCYNPGETIPLTFSYSGPSLSQLSVNLYIGTSNYPNSWFSNLMSHIPYPGNINDDAAFSWDHFEDNRSNWQNTDLSIWSQYAQDIENQGNADFVPTETPTLAQKKLLNINSQLVYVMNHYFEPTFGFAENIYLTDKTSETFKKTLIAPENPGLYDITLSLKYFPTYGSWYSGIYHARHQISVCNKVHDADFTIPGAQSVDAGGVVRDEDGSEMPGYTVYSPDDNLLIQKFVWPSNIYNGQIIGFNNVPAPKLSFATLANYCGYKNPASTWDNSWVNFYSSIKDTILNTRAGWDAMNIFYPKKGQTGFALFAYKPYPLTGAFQYYQTTDAYSISQNSTWYVHNDADGLKFINIDDIKTAFNNGVDLNNYSNIPKYTFADMLTNQTFNVSNWFDASNNVSNTYLVKENLKYGSYDAETTCSIYEDFCPSLEGIQYLRGNGSNIELWNIEPDSTRNRIDFIGNTSSKEAVDSLCKLTTKCIVESPINPQNRKVNTPITFRTTITNVDNDFPLTYTWQNATPVSGDPSKGTTLYTQSGTMTDVTVTATNGTASSTATCEVHVPLACYATPSPGNVREAVTWSSTADTDYSSFSWLVNSASSYNSSKTTTYTTAGVKTATLRAYFNGVGYSGYENTTCEVIIQNTDFCPDTAGTQYLIENGQYVELWNIHADNSQTLIGSIYATSPQADIDALCNFTTQCIVQLPEYPETIKVNTPITFLATTKNADNNFPLTYTWENATPVSGDPSVGTTQYAQSGTKTDVTVTATNGTNSSTATCEVQVPLACYGTPSTVTVGETVTWSTTADSQYWGVSYSWYGDDIDDDNAFYSESPIAEYAYTTPGIKWASLDVFGENWWQYDYAECEITVVPGGTPPTIDTPTVTDITGSAATLGATVTSVGVPSAPGSRGVCWGTSPNPTLNPANGLGGEAGTTCEAEGALALGIFTVPASGLTPGTLYYYRGYARNPTGIAYTGGTFSFTPIGPSGQISANPNPCIIAAGDSTCSTNLTWSTSNLIPGKATAVTTPGRSDVSAATSGTNIPVIVEYAGRNFYLYHNGAEPPLASVSVTAECATGSTWDGSICLADSTTCPPNTTLNPITGLCEPDCKNIIVYNNSLATPLPAPYTFSDSQTLHFQCESTSNDTQNKFQFEFNNEGRIDLNPMDFSTPEISEFTSPDREFSTGTSVVTCYAPSADGLTYSTSPVCTATICIGTPAQCAGKPYKLENPIVSDNTICTKEPLTNYTLSCDSTNPLYATCNANLQTGAFVDFRINNSIPSPVPTITCSGTDPKQCTVDLPSGAKIEIQTTSTSGIYQEIQGSTLDNKIPIPSIEYYTGYVSSSEPGTLYTPDDQWTKEKVTAVVKCANTYNENTLLDITKRNLHDECACEQDPLPATNWTIHDATQLPTPLFFSKTFESETTPGQTVTISDTARNTALQQIADLKIDREPPELFNIPVVPPGIQNLIFSIRDPKSGIVQYDFAKIPVDCTDITKDSATIPEAQKTILGFDPASDYVYYCMRDAVGNLTTGIYPFDTSAACFSDDTTSVDLTNYGETGDVESGLWNRVNYSTSLAKEKRGYFLSDPARRKQTLAFQTQLAKNINTYITSKYCATQLQLTPTNNMNLLISDNISDDALIKPKGGCGGTLQTRNSQGYYYYEGNGTNRVLTLTQTTEITKPIVVYVVGANIQIDTNLLYSKLTGTPSLVIIAQRDSNGFGGGIYVNPSVTHIDATLIADGPLMNGINNAFVNWIKNTQALMATTPNSLRLLINGRLLTHNTRGGSLRLENGGLVPIKSGNGFCANGPTIVQCAWDIAAAQDLERFRFEPNTTNNLCTLHVTGILPAKRPDILTTLTY